MNREIKFRVRDKVREVYLNDDHGFRLMYLRNGSTRFFNQDRWIFEQYTGLNDKNGKEIWVGDIVKCWDEDCGEVYFDTIFLQYRVKFSNGDDEDLSISEPEVVGTIHENPELLGDKE